MGEQAGFAAVSGMESGQKLLRFLERRLGLPANLLHRWLRTGQIRLNGKRCKPFEIVNAGDEVRLPPFALKLACAANEPQDVSTELPPLLGRHGDIMAFNKPAGLLCQPDRSGRPDFRTLLASFYADLPFKPAPAHRLDRETSGVILVGASFQALKLLHTAFRDGRIHKEYLAWVGGRWENPHQQTLKHFLADNEGVTAHLHPAADSLEARCIVRPILLGDSKSLLQINLLTGRKRQIRAQLAACGHPVLGDSRYASPEKLPLLLHSCRAILPDGVEFGCLPGWTGDFAVTELPKPIAKEHKEKEHIK